ncbi:MAG: hypothetical protein ACOCZ5_00675 [bacterium]
MPKRNELPGIFLKKNREQSVEESLIGTWHYLMIHYGYIPFDEFLNMDANLVTMLVEKLNEMNKKNQTPQKGRKGGLKSLR